MLDEFVVSEFYGFTWISVLQVIFHKIPAQQPHQVRLWAAEAAPPCRTVGVPSLLWCCWPLLRSNIAISGGLIPRSIEGIMGKTWHFTLWFIQLYGRRICSITFEDGASGVKMGCEKLTKVDSTIDIIMRWYVHPDRYRSRYHFFFGQPCLEPDSCSGFYGTGSWHVMWFTTHAWL